MIIIYKWLNVVCVVKRVNFNGGKMQKLNMFRDKDYCGLIAMCVSYKCPFGIATFALESYMADMVLMNTMGDNNSVFDMVTKESENKFE
jgi:hypothetical protein